MNTEIKLTDTNAAMAAVRHEIALEQKYKQIGLAFNINALMLGGGNYQQFTNKYSKFSEKGLTTPSSFSEMNNIIFDFVDANGFDGDKSTNAGIWIVSRIWKKKHEAEIIFDAVIRNKYQEIYQAKKEQTELHKAVCKLAKGKSDDSFEAGLSANFKELMKVTGVNQLRQLVTDTEQSLQLESIETLSGAKNEAA